MNYEQAVMETSHMDEVDSDFHALILYDHRQSAEQAMQVFRRFCGPIGEATEVHCHLWRFDVVELPERLKEAVGAGRLADLLIVAARSDAELPAAVKELLTTSLEKRTPGCGAIVALLGASPRSIERQGGARSFLHEAANRAGLDFFFYETDPPKACLVFTREVLKESANRMSTVLEGILQQRYQPQ